MNYRGDLMLAGFSVRKPYTVVVVVLIIILLGGISLYNMSVDLLPSINLPYTVVVIPYPGASPEEVESRVIRLSEQALASTSNIRNINSVATEHLGIILMEFSEETNMDAVVIEIRESLDFIATNLPQQAQKPMILKLNPDMMPIMALSAAVEGSTIAESSDFLENIIIPELESVEGIAAISASGLLQAEIHVQLNNDKIKSQQEKLEIVFNSPLIRRFISAEDLKAFEEFQNLETLLSTEIVSGILAGQNLNMPVGYITAEGTNYLIRVGDSLKSLDELKTLPVFSLPMPLPGFETISVGDIADIKLVDQDQNTYAKVNNNEAAILSVQKQPNYATSDLASKLRAKMKELEAQHEGLMLISLMDQGEYIDFVVFNMGQNLIIGGLLAILILLIFLRDLKPTIVMAFSIPISLLAALVLMYFNNVTLNLLSMGGLALGVGMLVDNSIVVMENIYRMRHEGKSAKEAAVKGASQVSGAIIASTLTTVSVFLPIVFTSGLTRQLFTEMGLTIAFALLASLIVALSLIPMLSANLLKKQKNNSHHRLKSWLEAYEKVINYALGHKGLVITLVIVLLAISIWGAMRLGTELFPTADMDQLALDVTLPTGTSFQELSATADQLTELFLTIDDVKTVGASMGGDLLGMGFDLAMTGDATISYYLILNRDRQKSSQEVASVIRTLLKDKDYQVDIMDMGMDMMALTGGDIVLNIKGRDLDTLQHLAKETAALISEVPGAIEISDGLEDITSAYQFIVDREKSIGFGLTTAQIMMEIAAYLSPPQAATTLRLANKDIDVFVLPAQESKKTLSAIKELQITAELIGEDIPLKNLFVVEEAIGLSSIQRENQQRFISVTANVADDYNIGFVSREIQQKISALDLPPNYSIELGGEILLISESFDDLYLMLILGVIFIYLIMVAQFQSLLSPFIVMFTIPLAFSGGFFSLIITNNPLSIVAFIGLIILAGIIVNNGIVFVDYINKMRELGLEKKQAILKAGKDRFRPIVMTALTTVFALSTMAMGVGQGTEIIQPMAITAVGGLIYATLLTLILIPVLYDALHRK